MASTVQQFSAGAIFVYQLPRAAFEHSNANSVLSVTARLASGEPLPNWLSFSPEDWSFTGQAPEGIRFLDVVIIVTDQEGNQAITELLFEFD
jgi:hypothetical protein